MALHEPQDRVTTAAYLESLGVAAHAPALSPFDPGYDAVTLGGHLEQSAHLISILKISMACWLVADEATSRRKVALARAAGVRTTTGGGPFEIAVALGRLPAYLDLVAEMGFDRIECGAGFTDLEVSPRDVVASARARGLEVQFELGKKHDGNFDRAGVDALVEQGKEWVDAGVEQLVVEARESALDVGVFDAHGRLNAAFADRFVDEFGHGVVVFEAPNKASQFAFLDHFGADVHLCNVRLEEILRVEIYRRGLHSDAFGNPLLRPGAPA